ncbi:plasma membrane-associated cation-binding protein 1 [Amaranthus tricolor]|uniref:plasma membrane-associated cation-binding protein 1 n=1 Tax=Amaranthus tricolor TaxID=29722 RepID=UPI00258DCF90|nr:plasma membrane-associated cation-binding protein 1 [Amaranthus tricolor]
MGYWKTKVLPKIQKVFGKDVAKKAAAVEACKSFNDSKEEVSKEFEEKKAELQLKVVEIYEKSDTEIQTLVKDPKEADLKKHSVKVQKFLDELVKIEFPGSKLACEASSKFGPALVPGPIIFVFEKVSCFIVTEDKTREIQVEPTASEPSEPTETSKPDKVETAAPADTVTPKEVDPPKAETAAEDKTVTPKEDDPPKAETAAEDQTEPAKDQDPPKEPAEQPAKAE